MNILKVEQFRPCEVKNVSIPENATMFCPKQNFKQMRGAHCITCEYNNGVYQLIENTEGVPFNKAFRLLCGHPILRRFEVIE